MTRQDFGPAIRAARLRAGLTQAEVGRLLGRHWNTIARWERGERTPDVLTQEGALARLNAERNPHDSGEIFLDKGAGRRV